MITAYTAQSIRLDFKRYARYAYNDSTSPAPACYYGGMIEGMLLALRSLAHDDPKLSLLIDELCRIREAMAQAEKERLS